jgi:hypothetical protein
VRSHSYLIHLLNFLGWTEIRLMALVVEPTGTYAILYLATAVEVMANADRVKSSVVQDGKSCAFSTQCQRAAANFVTVQQSSEVWQVQLNQRIATIFETVRIGQGLAGNSFLF